MKQHVRLLCGPLSLLLLVVAGDPAKAETPKKADGSYNHLFDIRNIEGWTVYINKKDLAEHPQKMEAASLAPATVAAPKSPATHTARMAAAPTPARPSD